MHTQTTIAEFVYPGTTKSPNEGSYGGFNYFFPSGWVITLSAGGSDRATLCFAGFRGRIHDINEIMGEPTPEDWQDKRYLDKRRILDLFQKVSALNATGSLVKTPD